MDNSNFEIKLEIKSLTENGIFTGYASVFNVVDKVNDKILSGAFAESLDNYREENIFPPLLWQHNADEPIGEWLEMYEDETGLFVKGQLYINEIATAREAYALLNKRIVTGLSIGYKAEEYYKDARGVRILSKVSLQEVSLVTFPANDYARVSFNEDEAPIERELETILRTVGLSRKQAKGVVACGYKGLSNSFALEQLEELVEINMKINEIVKNMEKELDLQT